MGVVALEKGSKGKKVGRQYCMCFVMDFREKDG